MARSHSGPLWVMAVLLLCSCGGDNTIGGAGGGTDAAADARDAKVTGADGPSSDAGAGGRRGGSSDATAEDNPGVGDASRDDVGRSEDADAHGDARAGDVNSG